MSRPRKQKAMKDIGPRSAFGTQSATAKRGVHFFKNPLAKTPFSWLLTRVWCIPELGAENKSGPFPGFSPSFCSFEGSRAISKPLRNPATRQTPVETLSEIRGWSLRFVLRGASVGNGQVSLIFGVPNFCAFSPPLVP